MAPRRIEGNFNQGWGIGLLVVALAVGLFVVAGMVHRQTYRPPTDAIAPATSAAGAPH